MLMMVELQAQRDFDRWYRRARRSRLRRFLTRRRGLPRSLKNLRRRRLGGERLVGLRTVAIDRIVGSEGRAADFTAEFMPASAALRARWERVDRAYLQGSPLPPVELLELPDGFYIRDGNHRVSVASFHQQQFVEADVVRLDVSE